MQHGVDWSFHKHVLGDVVLYELEFRVAQKVSDIVGTSGEQVVQAEDVISTFQQEIAQMTSEEPGTAGDYSASWRVCSFFPNTIVGKAEFAEMFRIIDVSAIENDGLAHHTFHALEIGTSECLPFGDYKQGVGALEAAVIVGAELNSRAKDLLGLFHGFGIVCRHRGSLCQELFNDGNHRRITHVVRPGFKCESPHAEAFAFKVPEVPDNL